jgi:hypothetical protein
MRKAAANPEAASSKKGVGKKASTRTADSEGKRIRVWPVVTLPRPEFVIFSQEGFLPAPKFSRLKGPAKHCYPLLAGASWLHHQVYPAHGPLSGEAKTPLGPHQVNVINNNIAK